MAATQARFTQPDAGTRDRDVLDDLVLTIAPWARHRLGVSFDDGCADDGQRSFRSSAELELEQALTSLLQLALGAFGLTPLASWS